MIMMKKNHEGEIKPHSASAASKVVKEPWGCVADCRFPVTTNDQLCYGMTNLNKSQQAFRADQFDPSLWKTCPFTTRLMSLRSEGQESKLAQLIAMMLRSKPFAVRPDDSKYDKDGLEIEVVKGYSLVARQEVVDFLTEAVSASVAVESLSEVVAICRGSRKRDTEAGGEASSVGVKKKRFTQQEQIEKDKLKELAEEDGIEKAVKVRSRMSLKLDDIQNSEHLEKESPVNAVRVMNLVKSMEQNFDLAQMVLTVTHSDRDPTKYDCIQGRNRLSALKMMDQTGSLKTKKGFEDRNVLCVLIESSSPTTQSYVHHRGNKIQSDVRKFNPVQVIFSIENLRLRNDKEKVAEIIRRYGVQLGLPADDVGLLKKLSLWLKSYTILSRPLNKGFLIRLPLICPLKSQKTLIFQ